jgi:hypothetical protein
MSPSQIVKSAYPAGCTYSLKSFASQVVADGKASPDLIRACKAWLATKAAQRKQAKHCARSARRGHTDVHEQLTTRARQHAKPASRNIDRDAKAVRS